MKLKRIITIFISAVTMLTCMPLDALAAQTPEVESGQTGFLESDLSVNGTNSFGNLLADELNTEYSEQQGNNGCNVFSAEVTDKTVAVEFETTTGGTLLAAIYDEAGEQMLASGSIEVTAEETKKEVAIEIDSMPQYFYLKVFLVDTLTLRPLCTAYESPNYTQEMQEFLAKTVDDFAPERVLNLDEDKTNNFAVYGENTVTAESSEDVNKIVSADENTETYVIESPDSTVAGLQNGDVLACEQENHEVLIVKVESIEISGDTATITGQDTSMEDVFEYVKIDSSQQAGEADYDPSTLSEGITYEGFGELEQKPMPKPRSFGVIEDEGVVPIGISLGVKMAKAGGFTLTGGLKYSADFSMKLYLSLKRQFIEFKVDSTLAINLTLTGTISEKIKLGTFDMMIFPGVNVGVVPKFITEASVSFSTTGTLTSTVGFGYEHAKNKNNFYNLTTKPKYKDTMSLEGKIEFGLELEPNVSIISSKLVRLGFTGSATVQLSLTRDLYDSEAAIEKDKYHECKVCFAGDIKVGYGVSIDLTFLDSDKIKLSKDLAGKDFKITDLYYSVDHNDYNYGTCPWQQFRVTLVVLGEDMQPLSSAYVKIDDDEETYMTDTGGVVRFYLPGNSTHTVTVEDPSSGMTREKHITVKRSPRCVYLWMLENNNHQGGGGSLGNVVKEEPYDPLVLDENNRLSLGGAHSAYIDDNGSLYMWGSNGVGQLGKGTIDKSYTTNDDNYTPKKIMDNVKAVSLGESHSAAITKDGSLYMWGDNSRYQFGNGTHEDSTVPIKIMDNVKSVSLGQDHSAAITEDGSLYMWGFNCDGQLGIGVPEEIGIPQSSSVPIKILDNVKSVSLGDFHSAAITEDGSLYTWGDNEFGALGRPQDEMYFVNHVGYYYGPTPVKIMDNVKSVSLGGAHSGAITEDGSLYMWGYNIYGQLGNGESGRDENHNEKISTIPIKIMDNVKSVSLGEYYSSAITEDGSLYMWGNNAYGELGNGTTEDSSVPIKIMDNVKSVKLGSSHSSAITEDGNLYMWGYNRKGNLGNGARGDSSVPIKIEIPTASTYSSRLSSEYSLLAGEETQILTKNFKNLLPNEIYNFYVLKAESAENLLGSDNLLYMDQYTSDAEGNITAAYIQKEEFDGAIVFLVRMSPIQLTAENTNITAEDLTCTGESQVVTPVVLYDGMKLIPGTDYDVEGDFSAVSEGEYKAVIVGKGNYSGKVEFTYKITCNHEWQDGVCTICGKECQHEFIGGVCSICGKECQHEFVDGVCTICGEIKEVDFLLGDANNDGKISAVDASIIFSEYKKIYRDGVGTFTDEDIIRCDSNDDGKITAVDASYAFSEYKRIYRENNV